MTAHACRLIIRGVNVVVPAVSFVQQKSAVAVDYVQKTKEAYFPAAATSAAAASVVAAK